MRRVAALLVVLWCALIALPSSSAFLGVGTSPAMFRAGRSMSTRRSTCRQVRMQAQEDAKDVLARAEKMSAGAGASKPSEAEEKPTPPVAPMDQPVAEVVKASTADAPNASPVPDAPVEKPSEGTNKYKDFENNWVVPTPSPTTVPEEVVKQLLTALKNNNKPQPNAGLSTVLAFSSPSNPITRREPEFFFGMMQNSQYSLLLGKFNTFRIAGTEDLTGTGAAMGSEQTVAVQVELLASTQAMMDAGVDFNFMDTVAGKDESTVTIKWQLSKDPETDCWLSDTLFFVPVAKKGKTMVELTGSETATETARFTGTPASQKLKAQAVRAPAKVETSELAKKALAAKLLKPTSPLLTTGMAGNKGFDPAGLASSPDLLLQYREAELKHSRLAMLAAVGWIASEVLHTPLANLFGADSLLQEGADSVAEKVPTVLNGGLESVQPTFWVAFFLLAGVAEAWRMLTIAENPMNFTPGAIGFDPLKIYDKADSKGRRDLELKEINNGRLAMLAVAYFAVAEKFGDAAIINSIPFLPKTGNVLEEVAEEVLESLLY